MAQMVKAININVTINIKYLNQQMLRAILGTSS